MVAVVMKAPKERVATIPALRPGPLKLGRLISSTHTANLVCVSAAAEMQVCRRCLKGWAGAMYGARLTRGRAVSYLAEMNLMVFDAL